MLIKVFSNKNALTKAMPDFNNIELKMLHKTIFLEEMHQQIGQGATACGHVKVESIKRPAVTLRQ